MKKQSLIKATFVLGFAGILSKFLGIFFRWPLQLLIGDEGVGYYQMSYPLYMFFIAVASGIPVAVSKIVSEKNADGDIDGSFDVFNKALMLMFIMGIGFSFFLLMFSNKLIYFFKWDTKALYALIAIAFAPIIISVMSAFRGFFQGFQNMGPTAVSQVIEQIGRILIGISLAFILLPKGIEYSAAGAAFGATAGGIFATIYLFSKYVRCRRNYVIKKIKNTKSMELIIRTAIPISVGACSGSIMNLIDSAIVPRKLLEAGFTYKESTILFGQLSGKAAILINVPLTLSIALSAALVPIISEYYVMRKKIKYAHAIENSIKLANVISFPSFLGLYFFSYPILSLIFRGQTGGALILKFLAISIPFLVLTQITTSILQSINKFKIPVFNLFIGCIVKIAAVVILVPKSKFNIYGAVIGSILAYIITSLLNLLVLIKTLRIKMNIYELFLKPAMASIIMIIFVEFIYLYVYNVTVSMDLACIVAIFIGVIIYLLLVVVFKIFSYKFLKEKFRRR
ncbi:MAG: oligosaccharide flippase family protein [Clostridiaceae bacterium]